MCWKVLAEHLPTASGQPVLSSPYLGFELIATTPLLAKAKCLLTLGGVDKGNMEERTRVLPSAMALAANRSLL